MPSPIGTVNQLVAVIRAQLSARPEIVPTAVRQSSNSPKSNTSTEAKTLNSLIGQRVKNIDRDDPQRGRKAFRIFLESILLSHFGENLMNDPKFYQMVDEIHIAMEADVEVSQQIDSAFNHLLSENRTS